LIEDAVAVVPEAIPHLFGLLLALFAQFGDLVAHLCSELFHVLEDLLALIVRARLELAHELGAVLLELLDDGRHVRRQFFLAEPALNLSAAAACRLALAALRGRGLREEPHDRLVEAARPVLGSEAVPRAAAAWAARLTSRRAELPDLRADLERVAADPELGDLLLRLLDVLVLSEGCVEL
jgi:hypothetical protein